MTQVVVVRKKNQVSKKDCVCRFYNTKYCVAKKQTCSQDESCEQLTEAAFSSLVEASIDFSMPK